MASIDLPAPEFTVLVPCYNEEGAIEQTIDFLRSVLGESDNYELMIINDGSSDGSAEVLERVKKRVPQLRVVHHEVNSGYGAALKTGIRRCRSELIVITDADGTYPCERIPELVGMCHSADMIVGARIGDNVQYSNLRKVPKVFLKAYASWLTGQHIPDMNSGLRVFRRSVVEKFLRILPDGFSFTTTITMSMMRNRYRVEFVPISYKPRIGKSKIKPIRDTLRFAQLILRTGMYFGPLRVLGPVIAVLVVAFLASLGYDIFVVKNLNEMTMLLMLAAMNTGMFALLADMIDKRSNA